VTKSQPDGKPYGILAPAPRIRQVLEVIIMEIISR
jgi:hypothetical protein